MNVFERIDALILSFFTKISHKVQIWTGKTNFFLAKCCIFLLGLSLSIHLINFFIRILNQETSSGFLIVMLLVGIILNLNLSLIEREDKEFENSAKEKTRNPNEIELLIFRLMGLFNVFVLSDYFSIIQDFSHPKTSLIFEILNHEFSLVACSFLYFMSVTPLPPGKSKVRQWLDSFGKVLKPIPVRSRN